MIAGLAREMQYLITNYNHEAIFCLSVDELYKLNWFHLLRDNFGYDGSLVKSITVLIIMYIDKCRKKSVICGKDYAHIRTENNLNIYVEKNNTDKWDELLAHTNINLIDDIVAGENIMFIKFRNGIDSNYVGYWLLGNRCEDNRFGWRYMHPHTEFKKIKPKKIDQLADRNGHLVILLINGTVMECNSIFGEKFTEINIENVRKIICSNNTTFFLLNSGKLMAKEDDRNRAMNMTRTISKNIFEIPDIPNRIIDVACGESHTLLLLRDGTLMSSGVNRYGQLGQGDTNIRRKFEIVKGIPKNITRIHCRYETSFVLLSDGTLMIAGSFMTFDTSQTYYRREAVTKFRVIDNIPKNIKDFSCTKNTTIIQLNDDKIIQIGNQLDMLIEIKKIDK